MYLWGISQEQGVVKKETQRTAETDGKGCGGRGVVAKKKGEVMSEQVRTVWN